MERCNASGLSSETSASDTSESAKSRSYSSISQKNYEKIKETLHASPNTGATRNVLKRIVDLYDKAEEVIQTTGRNSKYLKEFLEDEVLAELLEKELLIIERSNGQAVRTVTKQLEKYANALSYEIARTEKYQEYEYEVESCSMGHLLEMRGYSDDLRPIKS